VSYFFLTFSFSPFLNPLFVFFSFLFFFIHDRREVHPDPTGALDAGTAKLAPTPLSLSVM